jgi:hypothetical protein
VPVKTRPIPPWRSTSRSLIESAPAIMPAMIADTLTDAFAPAVPGTVTCSIDQVVQAGLFGQSQHRRQPTETDQVRVIENRFNDVGNSHYECSCPG